MEIYYNLPDDIQRVVKSFFYIWERFGFNDKPKLILSQVGFSSYFLSIRKIPRGIYYHFDGHFPTFYYYRLQRHFFEWQLDCINSDINNEKWEIVMRPQWNDNPQKIKKYVKFLSNRIKTFGSIILPSYISTDLFEIYEPLNERALFIDIEIIRSDDFLPSRQSCFEDLCQLIKNLAEETQSQLKYIK